MTLRQDLHTESFPLSIRYFQASCEELLLQVDKNPKAINLAWLIRYCVHNKLSLILPSQTELTATYVSTVIKGLIAYNNAQKYAFSLFKLMQDRSADKEHVAYIKSMYTDWIKRGIRYGNFNARYLDMAFNLIESLETKIFDRIVIGLVQAEKKFPEFVTMIGKIAHLYIAYAYVNFIQTFSASVTKALAKTSIAHAHFIANATKQDKSHEEVIEECKSNALKHLAELKDFKIDENTKTMLQNNSMLDFRGSLKETIAHYEGRLSGFGKRTQENITRTL